MHEFTEPDKAVGIILDLSLRHDSSGNRLIDETKKSLIELITGSFENDIDLMYLYHPDAVDVADKHGLQCCQINSYNTDGHMFNLMFALKQTLYAIAVQDVGFNTRKYVILITDRFKEPHCLDAISRLNQKNMIPSDVIHIHLDHPSELCEKFKIGEINGQ